MTDNCEICGKSIGDGRDPADYSETELQVALLRDEVEYTNHLLVHMIQKKEAVSQP